MGLSRRPLPEVYAGCAFAERSNVHAGGGMAEEHARRARVEIAHTEDVSAVIPERAERRDSGIHNPCIYIVSRPGLWIPALAPLGRNDGGGFLWRAARELNLNCAGQLWLCGHLSLPRLRAGYMLI
jgi:hypothetical protein